ncbi:MAG: DUF814 domain-containing protein [Nanoarchaeota archaeon]|nr:DUF814 domain-containing protein [Nanoarchaeota archaeon]
MEIELKLNKTVNENANIYFEKAKKLKLKLPGVEKTIEKTNQKIIEFEEEKESYLQKKEEKNKLQNHKKKEWYEKFRHTHTASGLLCVLGKDAGTNEILIKKHMDENDIVLHTEAAGSPFCVIKNAKDKISKEELEETAQFLSCFSKQWKAGFGTADAFWVLPEQLSKKAESGEYISKGSFMVRGKKNILKNIQLKICLGVQKKVILNKDKNETEMEKIEYEELFSGSENACKKYCNSRYIKIEPGNQNYKSLTKEIKKRLKTHIEDLPKYIPNNCKILKK